MPHNNVECRIPATTRTNFIQGVTEVWNNDFIVHTNVYTYYVNVKNKSVQFLSLPKSWTIFFKFVGIVFVKQY